ncbi:three-helix bundle dimerization domain-containing protein [Agromyces sp. PvR057]|uniref:three-helix bundle dimerization domain-containing protein n=1 Tax=Agromyces sp. PvR057 TaxID=3156403 RepID=UPI000E22126A
MEKKQVSEEHAVAEVVDRLAEKYPSVERAEIERIVADEYGQLDGRPVRDFVPVLIEKSAKKRVKRLVVA